MEFCIHFGNSMNFHWLTDTGQTVPNLSNVSYPFTIFQKVLKISFLIKFIQQGKGKLNEACQPALEAVYSWLEQNIELPWYKILCGIELLSFATSDLGKKTKDCFSQ